MASYIRRREILATLGGAAAWPLAARAQQAAIPRMGLLHSATPSQFTDVPFGQGGRRASSRARTSLSVDFDRSEKRTILYESGCCRPDGPDLGIRQWTRIAQHVHANCAAGPLVHRGQLRPMPHLLEISWPTDQRLRGRPSALSSYTARRTLAGDQRASFDEQTHAAPQTTRDQLLSSRFSSFQWCQSVPSARILLGLDLIVPASRSRNT